MLLKASVVKGKEKYIALVVLTEKERDDIIIKARPFAYVRMKVTAVLNKDAFALSGREHM